MKGFVKVLIKIFLCKIIYRVTYINDEVEKNIDKAVVCANHSNSVEPAWIYANSKDVAIMAKAELFENKILARILKYFDVFPIHRGQKDVKSILHAIGLFKNTDKRNLLVFPEGTRIHKNEEMGRAKIGPLFIAYKADVPIIPVYITKNARIFSRVKIIYGEPIKISKEDAADKERLQKKAEELLKYIYSLADSKV